MASMKMQARGANEWVVFEDHLHTKNIRFFRMALNHEDVEPDMNGMKLITLSSFYEEMKPLHGEVIIDYLKIGIRGKEWKVNCEMLLNL